MSRITLCYMARQNEPRRADPVVAERLRNARIKAGFRTAKAFSSVNNIPQPTYAMHEGGSRGLTRDRAVQYAKALGISLDYLLSGNESQDSALGSQGITDFRTGNGAETHSNPIATRHHQGDTSMSTRHEVSAGTYLARDVPLRCASYHEGDGDLTLATAAVDLVKRPAGLPVGAAVFAVYMGNDSMVPRFELGDLVFVHPHKPPIPGCDVLVELVEGKGVAEGTAYVKRLVSMSRDSITVREYHPKQREFKISRSSIKHLYRVYSNAELLGH